MTSIRPQSINRRSISYLQLISIFLITGILINPSCKTNKVEEVNLIDIWPEVVKTLVKEKIKTPSMILLIPEDVFNGNADFAALTVPAGPTGFDNFTPVAFLPDDDPPNGGQEPESEENGNDDGDNSENETPNQNGSDNGSASPFVDWPSINDLTWPPPIHLWPPPLDGPPSEEEMDEMLDEALENAFGDDESGGTGNDDNGDTGNEPSPDDQSGSEQGEGGDGETPDEDSEDEGGIRLKAYYKVDPTNLPIPWWDTPPDSDLPLPKPIELPEFDRYPRFKDLDEGSIRPPWWPLGKPWPPRTYGFPNEWRPDDSGFKLGDWRIYISPLPSNNN